MSTTPIWERCVSHRSGDAEDFVRDYFKAVDRRVGLIAGAGFDPRSARIAEILSHVANDRMRGLFLREERPTPHDSLRTSAEQNVGRLTSFIPNAIVESFDVFDKVDIAPVGGRRVIEVLRKKLIVAGLTDLVIDCSRTFRRCLFLDHKVLLSARRPIWP